MSAEAADKVFRLVRLRRFQEQRASADLRTGLAEVRRAEAALRDAEQQVAGLATWKTKSDSEGALDLDAYQTVLAYEHEAMQAQAVREQEHEQSLGRRDEATGRYVDAASATHVSERRHGRRAAEARDQAEKREFDQLSDLLLGNKEKHHG